jgi:hypothetical protein
MSAKLMDSSKLSKQEQRSDPGVSPRTGPDTDQLAKMKKAASLVEAPNSNKKPSEKNLKTILQKAKDKKERSSLILQPKSRNRIL